MTPEVKKTPLGFYQYKPLPDVQALQEYYSSKYYQQGLGSYETDYDAEELKWRRVCAHLTYLPLEEILEKRGTLSLSGGGEKKKFLDIGCGEGWLMKLMSQEGWDATGMDFSSAGIEHWNPDMLPYLMQGNIYEYMKKAISSNLVYDAINLGNVIEHVLDPINILESIKALLKSDGILTIIFPNDFSALQEYLIENKFVDDKYFLYYPDHLSYFNRDMMLNVLDHIGFKIIDMICQYPIELDLFSECTNYVKNKSIGKSVHRKRIRVENYMYDIDKRNMVQLYRVYAKMNLGRNMICYCSLR